MRHASFALPWVLAAVAVPAPVLAAETPSHWLLSVSDVSVSEESCAPHQAVFTVRLFKGVHTPPSQVVRVHYATADGTAVGGVDYRPAWGTLTFTPPNLVLTVAVPITDALVPAPVKSFTLNLSNPMGAIFGRSTGTATLHAPTVAKCASCGLVRRRRGLHERLVQCLQRSVRCRGGLRVPAPDAPRLLGGQPDRDGLRQGSPHGERPNRAHRDVDRGGHRRDGRRGERGDLHVPRRRG